jgi:hypothetical protein
MTRSANRHYSTNPEPVRAVAPMPGAACRRQAIVLSRWVGFAGELRPRRNSLARRFAFDNIYSGAAVLTNYRGDYV